VAGEERRRDGALSGSVLRQMFDAVELEPLMDCDAMGAASMTFMPVM